MKETTKISIKRSVEASIAGSITGIAVGDGIVSIINLATSNKSLKVKIIGSSLLGVGVIGVGIVGYKVWNRSDEVLGKEYCQAFEKELEGLQKEVEES